MVVLDVEVVVGVILPSGGVLHPAVFLDELTIVIFLRVFLSPKEQHMLAEMGQTIYLAFGAVLWPLRIN